LNQRGQRGSVVRDGSAHTKLHTRILTKPDWTFQDSSHHRTVAAPRLFIWGYFAV
jgi:hypothetical protein